MRIAIALGMLFATGSARADEQRTPVRLGVGETREIEVGFARMHLCDDPSIVAAEMRDKTLETNVFVLKGLKAGTTDCRTGLEEDRPTFLFTVTVVDKAPAKPAPTKPGAGPKTPAGPPPR